jgi:hypothetical protein
MLEDAMARQLRSVRVDPELLAELEELARRRLVPVTFAEQVDAGLRLLVRRGVDEQVRRSAQLVAVDRERAEEVYRQVRGWRP